MSADIDGFAVLRTLAAQPDRYRRIDGRVRQAARALLVAILKSPDLCVADLADLRRSFGRETLSLVIDGLTVSEVRGVIRKVDRWRREVEPAVDPELRRQVMALSEGEPPTPGPADPLEEPSQTPWVLSPLFATVWDGVDHD